MRFKINTLGYILLVLSLSFTSAGAQVVHEILLTVDVSDPENTEMHSLSIQSDNEVLQNFTLSADVGDVILWAADSEDAVKIVGVNYISGPRIFTSNILKGEEGSIKATIVRGGKDDYVYKLLYTIGSSSKRHSLTASIKTKNSN